MIDVANDIRQAFYAALNGVIDCPVYTEACPSTTEAKYVLLTTITEDDNSNKAQFATNTTIVVDVVHKTTNTTYDEVDATVAIIKATITPDISTIGVSPISPELQYTRVKLLSAHSLFTPGETVNVFRRLLRYSLTVIQSI